MWMSSLGFLLLNRVPGNLLLCSLNLCILCKGDSILVLCPCFYHLLTLHGVRCSCFSISLLKMAIDWSFHFVWNLNNQETCDSVYSLHVPFIIFVLLTPA